jgi:ribose transport system ATP-binding protein
MVEIAKALSMKARIIIMDEPTSSLTMVETDRLLALVKDLRSQGVGIVYISHRLGEIEEIADRAAVLRDGRNVGELARDEISHDRLVTMMVGRDIKSFYVESGGATEPGFFQARHLRSSRYPDCEVSFDAARGEILGFAGLVGAGRSEMAKALVGLDNTATAQLTIGDETIEIRKPDDAIRSSVFLVPEDRRAEGLVTQMTIRENISLPRLSRFAPMGLIKRALESATATKQVENLNVKAPGIEALVMNLSGGNQQKVVHGKWLALEPKVLILDEPTRGIDVGSKAEIYRLVRTLASEGAVVIMISSDMEEVLHLSDRIAVMCEGRITGVLGRADCNETNIMQLAVGRSVPQAGPACGRN